MEEYEEDDEDDDEDGDEVSPADVHEVASIMSVWAAVVDANYCLQSVVIG